MIVANSSEALAPDSDNRSHVIPLHQERQVTEAKLIEETAESEDYLTFMIPDDEQLLLRTRTGCCEEQHLEKTTQSEEDSTSVSSTRLDEAIARAEIVASSGSISPSESQYSSLLDENNNLTETWWKRQLAVLQTGGGHGNTLWSVAVAAAVLNLLILGRRSCIQNKILRMELDAKQKKISQLMYQPC